MIVSPGPLLVVVAYPDLTLPQADDGNALVLAHRARARGMEVEVRAVYCGEELPPADIYVIGGLEDEDQRALTRRLASSGLQAAIARGAGVLAVNSGYQVLGEDYALPDGTLEKGLGVLDVRSAHGATWIEGPVVTRPNEALRLPALSGYESHFGITRLGTAVIPLAAVEIGHGNGGAEPRSEGAVAGRVIGTYLHGPVLARNPEVADLLLGRVLERSLEPLPPSYGEVSRRRRIDEARRWSAGEQLKVKM